MRVAVTGSSGELGKTVTKELLENGYDVIGIDQRPGEKPGPNFILADLADAGQAYGSVYNSDAVVHLGAIRIPGGHPDEVVFRNNVLSTFNVVEAAAKLKLEKVIFASSINVFGFGFASRPFSPAYLPLDEDHPQLPQDPYGLSKVVGEEICAACSRRTGLTAISLRFTWVAYPQTYPEYIPSTWKDPSKGIPSFWSYVDARDCARTIRSCLEKELEGHQAFMIAAEDTFMKTPTSELVKTFFPDLADIRKPLDGNTSMIDTTKAQRTLGFKTQHQYRDYV